MMGFSTDRINETKCLINWPCLLPQLHRTSPCQRELWIRRWSWLHVFQCQLQPDSDVKALCQLSYFSDNLDDNLDGQQEQSCDVTNINLLNISTNTRSAKMSQGIHSFSTLFSFLSIGDTFVHLPSGKHRSRLMSSRKNWKSENEGSFLNAIIVTTNTAYKFFGCQLPFYNSEWPVHNNGMMMK